MTAKYIEYGFSCPEEYEAFLKPYRDRGFESREEYLAYLAEEYRRPLEVVNEVADTIGYDQDFDELPELLKSIAI